jgi:hypothetical protein
MKTIIVTALFLGLSTVSCKKEVQTTTPSNTDTIPAMDSMNNINPVPADTMTNQSQTSTDSTNIQTEDSADVSPR